MLERKMDARQKGAIHNIFQVIFKTIEDRLKSLVGMHSSAQVNDFRLEFHHPSGVNVDTDFVAGS